MIHAPSASRAASRSPSSSRRARTRARSSPAALSVKVIARTWSAPQAVLHDRGDEALDQHRRLARAGVGREHEVAVAAGDGLGLLGGEGAGHADAASQRQIVGMRAAAAVRARGRVGDRARPSGCRAPPAARRRAPPAGARRTPRRQAVLADAGQPRVGALEQQAARAPVVVAAQRLVEAADRLEAEQLRQREQVEADLQARVLEPLGLRRRALALVVVDDRLAAVGADVDAVDAALQAQLAAGQLGRPQRVLRRRRSAARTRCGAKAELPVGGLLDVAQQVGLQAAQRRAPALGVGRDRGVVGALVERGAQQRAGLVEALGRQRAAVGQRAQRVLQDAVGELAAQHRLGIGLERGRAQQALDEPLHRARGLGLQRRGRPRRRARR